MKGQKMTPQNIAYGPYRCTDLARLHDGAIASAMNADSFACYAVGQRTAASNIVLSTDNSLWTRRVCGLYMRGVHFFPVVPSLQLES
jgi:hypothetical protein